MIIEMRPFLTDEPLDVFVYGDTIEINGETIDFSVVPEGFKLPSKAVNNFFIYENTYIEKSEGVLKLVLRLPVNEKSPYEIRNPNTFTTINIEKGKLEFPIPEPYYINMADEDIK